MNFQTLLNQAWQDHATQTNAVYENLKTSLQWLSSAEQIPQLAHLVLHVFGEHCGKWTEGIALLSSFRHSPHFHGESESAAAIKRSILTLEICAKSRTTVDDESISDQIRIWAVATSAVVAFDRLDEGEAFFLRSLALAESMNVHLNSQDPANRTLAVTGNNLAVTLEEKSSRTAQETELMLMAARTGRKYWEVVGTAGQVQSAEYRLAMSNLKAGRNQEALIHANLSVTIGLKNQSSSLDMFFSYEILTLAEKQNGNESGFKEALVLAKIEFTKLSQ